MRVPQIPHSRRLSPAEIDAAVAEQDRSRDAAVAEAVEAGKVVGKEAGHAIAIKAATLLLTPVQINEHVDLVMSALTLDIAHFGLPGPVEKLVLGAAKQALLDEIVAVVNSVQPEAGTA